MEAPEALLRLGRFVLMLEPRHKSRAKTRAAVHEEVFEITCSIYYLIWLTDEKNEAGVVVIREPTSQDGLAIVIFPDEP